LFNMAGMQLPDYLGTEKGVAPVQNISADKPLK